MKQTFTLQKMIQLLGEARKIDEKCVYCLHTRKGPRAFYETAASLAACENYSTHMHTPDTRRKTQSLLPATGVVLVCSL